MSKLQDIIDDAIDALDNEYDHSDNLDHNGALHEIADGSVPVYYSELIDVACDDRDLLLTEPELGPAFGGEPTPVNIIAANIYEAVSNAVHARWNEITLTREDLA